MTEHDEILVYSIVWILLFAATLVVIFRRRTTVGLTAAFLMTFLANHWLASALYVIPWQTLYPPSIVAAGLRQSVLGMATFAFGALILAPITTSRLRQHTATIIPTTRIQDELPRQIRHFFLIGSASYFITPIIFGIPILNVITRETAKFAILAACLFIYFKIRTNARNVGMYAVLIGGFFVLIGVVYAGFASFGSVIGILLVMFYLSYSRFSARKVVFLVLASYIGLSAFVVYLGNRSDIRAKIWGGQPLASRLEVIWDTANKFEFFSIDNAQHLKAVEMRLNRNYYVGLTAHRIDSGAVDYASGETLLDAIIAPIPRVLWPDKPIISGLSVLFSKYTGLPVSPGTSSGVGILLESYINFGSAGVVAMFAIYGIVLGLFDARSRQALDTGQYTSFAIWVLVGYELVDPIDTMAGVVGAMVSMFLVLKAFFAILRMLQRDDHRSPANPAMLPEPVEAVWHPGWREKTPVRSVPYRIAKPSSRRR
jgi:hypothetical protein